MRRLAGPVGLVAAVAVVTLAVFAAARPDEEPGPGIKPNELVCTWLVADTCGAVCPCLLGEEPHHGTCHFVSVLEVVKGKIDGRTIDHARFAIAGSFSGPTRERPALNVAKAWVDPTSIADPTARKLLASFLATGLPAKRSFGVAMAGIQIARDPDPLGTSRFEIGGEALFTIKPLVGADGKKPLRIENGFSPFPGLEPIIVGTSSGKLDDPDVGMAVSNGSGEIHKVTLTVPPAASPGS
jgi:hypothetical protein